MTAPRDPAPAAATLTDDERESLMVGECDPCRQGILDVEPCVCGAWLTIAVERIVASRVAEVERERDEARASRDEGWAAYREAVGVPPSRHQAERLERMAQAVESSQVEVAALRKQVEAVRALADEWDAVERSKPYAMTHIAACADDLRAALDAEAVDR